MWWQWLSWQKCYKEKYQQILVITSQHSSHELQTYPTMQQQKQQIPGLNNKARSFNWTKDNQESARQQEPWVITHSNLVRHCRWKHKETTINKLPMHLKKCRMSHNLAMQERLSPQPWKQEPHNQTSSPRKKRTQLQENPDYHQRICTGGNGTYQPTQIVEWVCWVYSWWGN